MAKILDFKANNTTPGSGSLTNVVGIDWTVVRNSVANYNNLGIVTEVAVNVPRIQDGKTLIEQQKTNLLPYSEDFSLWTPLRALVDNGHTSPDGTANASGIIGTSVADEHLVRYNADVVTSNIYEYSVYLKQGNKTWVRLRQTSTDVYADFDLVNGVIGTTVSCTPSIEDIGSGWFRCSILYTSTTTTASASHRVYPLEADGNSVFSGDDITVNTYCFGGQCEDVSITSYISTNGATITREADVITNTVPNGTAPITMTTWIDGVSDGGVAVNQGDPITMVDGTTGIEIDDSASSTTTVEIEWIDSISASATGNKIYRDDVEIADIANGIQIYQDDTAETGTEYKYEVQAHDGAGDETTQEVEGENMDYITTAS